MKFKKTPPKKNIIKISSLCVIYPRGRSVHSSKNYKTYEKSKISLWHNKNLKTVSFLFLTQYFFSLWWAAGDVMGKTFFLFSLAVFLLQNLCNLPS